MTDLHDTLVALARSASSTLDGATLDPALDFYTQGFDSLDHVQILMKVEEHFDMRFADEDYDTCNSISGIAEFLVSAGHAGRGNG